MSTPYPLCAIVGQERLIEALLINAVSPEVGGVLVRGERGTAKSTAVRGLAPLLPPVTVARGQAFAFAPGEVAPDGLVAAGAGTEQRAATLVELPLGASLDRLVGALDLGRALRGEKAFEAGLLARAHQGILYVDEVNLLPDHLVDALLDAAASGVSRVERDAVSAVHDARFLLVGTMNVEEGELRPQLLDRFGLGVEVTGPPEPDVRAEIVRRRLAFERDADAFAREWQPAEEELARRIAAARTRLPHVRLPERELLRITAACASLGVDGVRGDIVTARAARALAALAGLLEVEEEHVRRAAALALLHRRRRDPLDGHEPSPDDIERALDDEPPPDPPSGGAPPDGRGRADPPPADGGAQAPAGERRDRPAPARLPAEALRITGTGSGPGGRRARSSGEGAGAIDSRPAGDEGADISIVATLRARLVQGDSAGLHEHVRGGRESVLLCLVVDASGSMGARRRLARVKGALLELLREAYERRDRVAVVSFRGSDAQVLVAPGAPLGAAAEAIRQLPTGGRTPLAAGLGLAEQVIRREAGRDRGRRTIAVILTDGRVEDPTGDVWRAAARLGRAADAAHVIDIEDGPVRLGLAARVARAAGARRHVLTDPPAMPRTAA
ncbi:MAG: magnesium chelatase subunit [Gaiellales bacterium]|nr:magnesium chelatase subunit [Gaiellales bacterium]